MKTGGMIELDAKPEAEQRREWEEARQQGIGASDVAAILGVSPWKSPYALWTEKALGLHGPKDPNREKMFRRGQILEPVVAALYSDDTKHHLVDHGRYTIARGAHPILFATLDREITGGECACFNPHFSEMVDREWWVCGSPNHPMLPGVLEIKTTSAWLRENWIDGRAPLPYHIQVQAQLAVTGYTWADLCCVIGIDDMRIIRILRDQPFIDEMLNSIDRFWTQVQMGVPPPIDGHDATSAALKRMFPMERQGKEIRLGDSIQKLDATLIEAKASRKKWEGLVDEMENHIKAAIGDAESAVLPDGTTYTLKTQHRKEAVMAASEFRVLRRKGKK